MYKAGIGFPHETAHCLTPPTGYRRPVTIRGSDLPPRVLAERFLDGHHQRLVDHDIYGTRWECDCPEYREIRPLRPKAYCQLDDESYSFLLPVRCATVLDLSRSYHPEAFS